METHSESERLSNHLCWEILNFGGNHAAKTIFYLIASTSFIAILANFLIKIKAIADGWCYFFGNQFGT
jgi:hypothetical protein